MKVRAGQINKSLDSSLQEDHYIITKINNQSFEYTWMDETGFEGFSDLMEVDELVSDIFCEDWPNG